LTIIEVAGYSVIWGKITMSGKMDPVIHFEMPAEDMERVQKFYGSAFGWQTISLGPDAGGFVIAFTSETDAETRMPEKRGFINGGFYKKAEPGQGVKLTILVDDIHEAIKKIKAAGGTVLGEPFELPGVGLFVSFIDTEGNVATINQDFTIKRL
jgi:predicted enzyme related to lactoylglutathione lyase